MAPAPKTAILIVVARLVPGGPWQSRCARRDCFASLARTDRSPLRSRRSEPQLLGEADALHLARGALRDVSQDEDPLRHLEVGQVAGGVLSQLPLVGHGAL